AWAVSDAWLTGWRDIEGGDGMRIMRIGPGHDLERDFGVGHGTAHRRGDTVQRAVGTAKTEGAGDRTGRCFEPDHTAMRRRPSARPATVGAEGDRCEA